MKRADVKIGERYFTKVSGHYRQVRVIQSEKQGDKQVFRVADLAGKEFLRTPGKLHT